MESQLEIFTGGVTDADEMELRGWLLAHGWQTRKQLSEGLGWPWRKVCAVAQQMGADVVRGQAGFKLTEQITREELPAIQQAADAAISQAKRMEAYGIALLRRIHGMVG